MQTVSLIAAVGSNGVIGNGCEIPWRLPADLQHFKRITMGHAVIMGRKTHAAIGKPLPGRRNIVITRQRSYAATGCEVAESLAQALDLAGDGEAFVIGGGEVYRQALPFADRLYLTLVDLAPPGDVFFPAIDQSTWHELERTKGMVDEKNLHPHEFVVLVLRRSR